MNSSRSPRWLKSWSRFAYHLERAARPTKRWRTSPSVWLHAWLPTTIILSICISVHLEICILISARLTGSFHSHQHTTGRKHVKRWKLETNFPKAVQQHYVGKKGKSITFCCIGYYLCFFALCFCFLVLCIRSDYK